LKQKLLSQTDGISDAKMIAEEQRALGCPLVQSVQQSDAAAAAAAARLKEMRDSLTATNISV